MTFLLQKNDEGIISSTVDYTEPKKSVGVYGLHFFVLKKIYLGRISSN